MIGDQLLGSADLTVIYSFTLYERGLNGNQLRVSTDSLDSPSTSIPAHGSTVSTSKLRTLVTYLELVEQARVRFLALPRLAARRFTQSQLSAWVIDYLQERPDASLGDRSKPRCSAEHSASRTSRFHRWREPGVSNFNRADNSRVLTIQQALQHR